MLCAMSRNNTSGTTSWTTKVEEMPVFGTIASQFNEPGTNQLYRRIMEVIASKMRTLACDAYFLLEYLAKNPEPGCRLAAVSLLEAKPDPAYLPWLSERPC